MCMHVCSASNLTPHKAIAAIIESIECAENQQEIMERTLNVEFVQCAQLTSNDNPPIRGRDPNIYDAHGNAQNTFEYQPDEEYENYLVDMAVGGSRNPHTQSVMLTQAPRPKGGQHYKVENIRSLVRAEYWGCNYGIFGQVDSQP